MGKQHKAESQTTEENPVVADLLLIKDRALDAAAEGITIADMSTPGQPLIYINEGFERLTGYSASSMLRKNCRFLQGEDTDPATLEQISHALASNQECTVEILNYKKNGEPFWNRLSLTPVMDSQGEVTHFIGVQSDITKRRNAEAALREANRLLEIANQKMTGDLEAAAKIQRSLLPEKELREGDVGFSWVFQPCDELGGDTLSILNVDDKRTAVYTVDVSGHGVRASLLSVTLSHWFSRLLSGPAISRAASGMDSAFSFSPVGVAEELNRQFQMNMENPQYFTMCYGVIDMEARVFRYVTAGNPPVIVARANGATEALNIEGFPIGIVEQPKYSENVIHLTPGDRVFLYTDGVIEAEDENENPFGIENLVASIIENRDRSLDLCIESIMESLKSRQGRRGQDDDISILAFQVAD